MAAACFGSAMLEHFDGKDPKIRWFMQGMGS